MKLKTPEELFNENCKILRHKDNLLSQSFMTLEEFIQAILSDRQQIKEMIENMIEQYAYLYSEEYKKPEIDSGTLDILEGKRESLTELLNNLKEK